MAKKRILLIDDDAWLTELLAVSLKNAGYNVAVASDALAGMDQIDKSQPDMIVLDLFMPGPNGIVLLHELRSHADLAKVPIVLCTNSTEDISPKQLAPYGVRGLLDKATMEPADIVAAVRRYT